MWMFIVSCWIERSFSIFDTFPYLDNLVVVYVVQSVGSIPTSNNRGVGQEVGAMEPILKIKLKDKQWTSFILKCPPRVMFPVTSSVQFSVKTAFWIRSNFQMD